MADQNEDEDRTTILVYQSTRKRIKKLAGERDCSYDDLANQALDKLEEDE